MLSNGVLSHRIGAKAENAGLDMELSKLDFVKLMAVAADFDSRCFDSPIKFSGDKNAITQMLASMDRPEPNFNIVLPVNNNLTNKNI